MSILHQMPPLCIYNLLYLAHFSISEIVAPLTYRSSSFLCSSWNRFYSTILCDLFLLNDVKNFGSTKMGVYSNNAQIHLLCKLVHDLLKALSCFQDMFFEQGNSFFKISVYDCSKKILMLPNDSSRDFKFWLESTEEISNDSQNGFYHDNKYLIFRGLGQ